MKLHVIILAQGNQARMGHAFRDKYKQMVDLPACGNVPVIVRTILQVKHYLSNVGEIAFSLVCWNKMIETAPEHWIPVLRMAGVAKYELADPGNSSLKGIARFLETNIINDADRTMVLFGDVIYSFDCLDAIWMMTERFGFVGTSDLRNDGGELWGVGWSSNDEDTVALELRDALLRHPPFNDDYQPGQMRRWLVGWRRGDVSEHVQRLIKINRYMAVDDFTCDIDVPENVRFVQTFTHEKAMLDDKNHGITW